MMLSRMLGLMQKEGPVVKTVVLRSNGELGELTMDMTPRLDSITKVLKGKATFLGQFGRQGVCLLHAREPVEGVHEENTGKLPFPFHELEEPIHGDLLMIKMSEESEPLDFTLTDYEVLVKEQKHRQEHGPSEEEKREMEEAERAEQEMLAQIQEAEGEEDEDEDEDDDGDDDDGEDDDEEEGEDEEEDEEEKDEKPVKEKTKNEKKKNEKKTTPNKRSAPAKTTTSSSAKKKTKK